MIWAAVLAGAAGCYLLKVVGLSVPAQLLEDPRVRRTAGLLPVALLTALISTQTFTTEGMLALDARVAGLAVAVAAVLVRAPFLVVVGLAAATAALIRLVG